MQDKTIEALKAVSEVFKFELWLRFYFIEEDNGRLRIDLDDQVLEKMGQEYGHLAKLASGLNRVDLDPETCRKAIVEHLMDQYDGKEYEIGYIPRILDNAAFKNEIQLFNAWAHLHENQLEKNIIGFDRWNELYNQWKLSESGQKMSLSLSMQEAGQKMDTPSEKTN